MPSDVQVELSVDDGRTFRPVTRRQLLSVGRILLTETRKQLDVVAKIVIESLRVAYLQHARQRIDGEPQLMEKLRTALRYKLEYIGDGENREFEMRAFDLEQARQKTRAGSSSWFDMHEDGHRGRKYGSRLYGFLKLQLAIDLASQCSDRFKLDEGDRAEFLNYVREHMAGKHGEGIMVLIDKPLFFKYRDFGTPLEHGVGLHPGFTAWNIYRDMVAGKTVLSNGMTADNSIKDAFSTAINAAANRITQGAAQ